jgi:hypothetical protein
VGAPINDHFEVESNDAVTARDGIACVWASTARVVAAIRRAVTATGAISSVLLSTATISESRMLP